MPMQRLRRSLREPTPADRLVRAIGNIDKRLELLRLAGQPISLSAHRARRILQEALLRCDDPRVASPSSTCLKQTARAEAMPKPHRPRRDPVERREALPGPPPVLAVHWDSGARFDHAKGLPSQEGMETASESTRKDKCMKWGATVLLGIAIILGVFAALIPLL